MNRVLGLSIAGVALGVAACGTGNGQAAPPAVSSSTQGTSTPSTAPASAPTSPTAPPRQVERQGLPRHVVAVVDHVANPVGIAYADGALWVSEHDADVVARIEPATLRITDLVPLPLQSGSGDPHAGPGQPAAQDRSVWVPGYVDGRLYRVDTRTRTAAAVAAPGTLCGRPEPANAVVWVDLCGTSKVAEVSPGSGRTGRTLPAQGIAWFGADQDRMWVSDYRPGRLRELASDGRVLRTTRVPGCPWLDGVAFGRVWYHLVEDSENGCPAAGTDRLFSWDPRTGVTRSARVEASPEVRFTPTAVWVDRADSPDNGSGNEVFRVDPHTLAVTDWTHLDAVSDGSVIHGDRMFVATYSAGTVTVLALR